MGWNNLTPNRPHPLLDGIATGPDGLNAYFVHSYHFLASRPDDVIATTDYGGALTAAVGRETIVGVQFHPEKSQTMGLKLISNFLRWRP
jgi:glutamine amidotransferase